MTCDESKLLLADYLCESLTASQDLAFEAHVASCESCRLEAERLGALWRGLALLPAEEPGVTMRGRFYDSLAAYRQGLESAPRAGWRDKLAAFWPRQPVWQMAAAFALLVVGVAAGYIARGDGARAPVAGSEVAQLREEVGNMRQLVALSLLQQQSASERLRGVSWAGRVEPSDTEVLTALLSAVNHDSNVNVRLAAIDALHAFASSPSVRQAVVQALPGQTTPLVQVALIDLLVDLKDKNAAPQLRQIASEEAVDTGVRQRAEWALERLQ